MVSGVSVCTHFICFVRILLDGTHLLVREYVIIRHYTGGGAQVGERPVLDHVIITGEALVRNVPRCESLTTQNTQKRTHTQVQPVHRHEHHTCQSHTHTKTHTPTPHPTHPTHPHTLPTEWGGGAHTRFGSDATGAKRY